MPLASKAIQDAVDKLEGESGVNVAKYALNGLIKMFYDNFKIPLDNRPNQVDMLGDLDSVIGELILFRQSMESAISTGSSVILEPRISGTDFVIQNMYGLQLSELPDKSEVN